MTKSELEAYRAAMNAKAQAEIKSCAENKQFWEANKQHDQCSDRLQSWNSPIKSKLIGSFLFVLAIFTVIFLLVGLYVVSLILLAVLLISYFAFKQRGDEIKRSNDAAYKALNAAYEASSRAQSAIQKKYDDLIHEKEMLFQKEQAEQAKKNRNAVLRKKREKFASSPALPAMTAWLKNLMEEAIRKADRKPSCPYICAELTYTLTSYCIYCEIPKYETGQYDDKKYQFEFSEHSLCSVSDKDDQIGLAQTLAKAVQFEMMNAGNSQGKDRTALQICADNNKIHLGYRVQNPNFIPSRKI